MSSRQEILDRFRKPGALAGYEDGYTALIFLDKPKREKLPALQIRIGPFPTRAEARNAAVRACARVKGKGFWIQNPVRTGRHTKR